MISPSLPTKRSPSREKKIFFGWVFVSANPKNVSRIAGLGNRSTVGGGPGRLCGTRAGGSTYAAKIFRPVPSYCLPSVTSKRAYWSVGSNGAGSPAALPASGFLLAQASVVPVPEIKDAGDVVESIPRAVRNTAKVIKVQAAANLGLLWAPTVMCVSVKQ